MHARQHVADSCAVHKRRVQFAAAEQFVHDRGGFAFEAVQDVTRPDIRQHGWLDCGSKRIFSRLSWHQGGDGRRRGGLGVGDRNAALGQVLHQMQVKRQLFESQPFKQCQDEVALVCVNKIIGVFNATRATLDGLQFAEAKRL